MMPGLIIGALMSMSTPAAGASLYPPGGFRLTFDGDPRGEHDGIILFVGQKGSGATYFVRRGVQVTETTVFADLGKLGSIDLHFVPSGEPRVERSVCNPHPIEFDSGFYEGRIDFEGEEGYAEAHRARARGEIRLGASLICSRGINEGVGGHSPGALLQLPRRWAGGRLQLEATKNSATRPSRFRALIVEGRDGVAIERQVEATAGSGAFEFDVPHQTALLKPPSPFNGFARFQRKQGRVGRLKGNLVVDFPGRSNVPLSGAGGSLQRWEGTQATRFAPRRGWRKSCTNR
jgi:hypothetical protein